MYASTLFLVGAGPGDPDLITLKAVKILQKAEVIIYDALANADLLQHCSSSSIKIFGGKRLGCHYLSQEEINALIIDYGRKYRTVVRLKGGDPFVFGRAHEEMEAARLAGMAVEVIPGISSAIAAPASQHIPLTCRGINESFWVTTGITKTGDLSSDIRLAAKSNATVVILMAMSKLEAIMEIFMEEGKKNTPVAIIRNATTGEEKCITGSVRDIFFKSTYEQLSNPAVIVVGEVVNLHPSFFNEYRNMVKLPDEITAERL